MKFRVALIFLSIISITACSSPDQASLSINPIEDSFKSVADSINYDFDPTSVVSKEYSIKDGDIYRAMNYDEVIEFSKDAPGVDDEYVIDAKRINVFMKFDGHYKDGYSGKEIIYEARLTLWENGAFTASVNEEEEDRHGVWYNVLGSDSTSGLKLVYPKIKTVVSGSSRELTEIECAEPLYDGYSWSGNLPFETKNKEAEIEINGYYYYPDIGIYVNDNGKTSFKLSRLETTIPNAWDTLLVLSNLKTLTLDDRYSYKVVKYEIDDIETPGTKTVTIRYKHYSLQKTIEVVE